MSHLWAAFGIFPVDAAQQPIRVWQSVAEVFRQSVSIASSRLMIFSEISAAFARPRLLM